MLNHTMHTMDFGNVVDKKVTFHTGTSVLQHTTVKQCNQLLWKQLHMVIINVKM